jgi:hypothetical protein
MSECCFVCVWCTDNIGATSTTTFIQKTRQEPRKTEEHHNSMQLTTACRLHFGMGCMCIFIVLNTTRLAHGHAWWLKPANWCFWSAIAHSMLGQTSVATSAFVVCSLFNISSSPYA